MEFSNVLAGPRARRKVKFEMDSDDRSGSAFAAEHTTITERNVEGLWIFSLVGCFLFGPK